MSDLNQWTASGRLGADPEVRRNQEGKPIVNLRLASSETWKDLNNGEKKEKTEWISVTIFSEGLAKVAEQYLRKGSRILVQGAAKTRKWADKDGNDRYSTEMVLSGYDAKMVMLDGPSNASGDSSRQREPSDRNSYGDDYDDKDLPF
jgi:single-strand DNA-binding protein